MKVSILVLIWTIVSIILNLSGVGAFATWDITAWPWHWSCLCILYWDLLLTVALVILLGVLKFLAALHKQRIINSYAPEQREFIRRIMDKGNR